MKILVTGGAGYVGSELIPKLLSLNHEITAYDLMLYGNKTLNKNKNLKIIQGDIRNQNLFKENVKNHEAVIHLACISNDPSFEVNPTLGKSINFDCFEPMVKISRDAGVKHFIYASSSSVYGIQDYKDVTENLPLKPITDYSKFKADCEDILLKYSTDNFITTIVRPATVCGYSKRQRLDLVVNIFTNLAFHKREINIFGGKQLRPNIHINDMCNVYIRILESSKDQVQSQIFNAGYENKSLIDLADIVKEQIGSDVKTKIVKTNDERSYHISSRKIMEILDFKNQFTIKDAVSDLKEAFETKKFINPLNNIDFYNIKKMQSIDLE